MSIGWEPTPNISLRKKFPARFKGENHSTPNIENQGIHIKKQGISRKHYDVKTKKQVKEEA